VADIVSDFPIKAPRERVFEAISTPGGLDHWWTKSSAGEPRRDAVYQLDFGPGFHWQGVVTRFEPPGRFELEIVAADADWLGTTLAFELDQGPDSTVVRFSHRGWPNPNDHWRVSCYCWPMYLRIMRRWLEHGETVPYEQRLDV
jgi:uncharacterized protein YndB with AHSA1/START domain